jgi:hypothetical protein
MKIPYLDRNRPLRPRTCKEEEEETSFAPLLVCSRFLSPGDCNGLDTEEAGTFRTLMGKLQRSNQI